MHRNEGKQTNPGLPVGGTVPDGTSVCQEVLTASPHPSLNEPQLQNLLFYLCDYGSKRNKLGLVGLIRTNALSTSQS